MPLARSCSRKEWEKNVSSPRPARGSTASPPRQQILEREQRLPDLLVACVGGGSNAIGLFHPFLNDESVRMIGVEAGGEGIRSGKHAARFQGGRLGVLQGTKTFLLANEDGQIELTHSVSAGLDYAAVGPEHS